MRHRMPRSQADELREIERGLDEHDALMPDDGYDGDPDPWFAWDMPEPMPPLTVPVLVCRRVN